MLILLEMSNFAAAELLLAGIPESVGLLAFGIGLVGLVVLIRRRMAKGQTERTDEKATKKA